MNKMHKPPAPTTASVAASSETVYLPALACESFLFPFRILRVLLSFILISCGASSGDSRTIFDGCRYWILAMLHRRSGKSGNCSIALSSERGGNCPIALSWKGCGNCRSGRSVDRHSATNSRPREPDRQTETDREEHSFDCQYWAFRNVRPYTLG